MCISHVHKPHKYCNLECLYILLSHWFIYCFGSYWAVLRLCTFLCAYIIPIRLMGPYVVPYASHPQANQMSFPLYYHSHTFLFYYLKILGVGELHQRSYAHSLHSRAQLWSSAPLATHSVSREWLLENKSVRLTTIER